MDGAGIAAALFLVAGCTDSTAPVAIARIEPATSTVILQSSPQGQVLTTSVIVTNTTPFDVSYSSCGVSMEKAGLPALPPGKSEWQTVWVRYCALLEASSSFTSAVLLAEVLRPGASITIPIVAVAGQLPSPDFKGEPGEYRFHVPMSLKVFGSYRPAPYEVSVSGSFTLLPAP